jgi:hypothetical protein
MANCCRKYDPAQLSHQFQPPFIYTTGMRHLRCWLSCVPISYFLLWKTKDSPVQVVKRSGKTAASAFVQERYTDPGVIIPAMKK